MVYEKIHILKFSSQLLILFLFCSANVQTFLHDSSIKGELNY